METPIKITIAMLAAALLPMAASAQIAYTGRQLNVGGVASPRDGFVNVADASSAVFRHGNTFIRYDLEQSIPYISGSNGYVGIRATAR